MENRKEIIFEPLPGGFAWITGGGTRQEIKFFRPWQKPLEDIIDSGKCPFCTKPQEEISLVGIPEGWRILPNPFTPHLRHRLIGPRECWPAEKLQVLGETLGITEALKTAQIAIARDDVAMAMFIHVGWMGGQNLGHPHWHLMQARIRLPFSLPTISPDREIADFEKFRVMTGGVHSGECLILPKKHLILTCENISELARVIYWIVKSCNSKFLSADKKLPPDFMVTVRIGTDHSILYADYCPVLSIWGSPEYVMAPLEGGPYTLPWPHEVTAAYLRK